MEVWQYFINTVTIFNTLFIILMIFKERKKPEIIVSWLLLFAFIPIVGFVCYILIGSGLSFKNRKMLRRKRYYDDNYQAYYRQLQSVDESIKQGKAYKLIQFNSTQSQSVATFDNNVQIFTDGKAKIEQLIRDLQAAKHSINIEYYIFANDFVGEQIMRILCEKARAGVSVKLIYDSVGSLKSPRKFFRQLRKAGGQVKEFFPPLFYIRLINLKMNYRNHRKIIVIDGKIAYTGGINLRKDHLGFTRKTSPWRDTHLRITGNAVHSLQNTFLNFWQFCNKKNVATEEFVEQGYFPKITSRGKTIAQVITSGPHEQNNNIKDAMIKMINCAEREIVLLTPYFVPDEVFLHSLKQALASGIRVRIMIPLKPDKKFVYAVSLSFVREMVECGAEVYRYNGFIHSKALIIDSDTMMIGTANADYRSFSLNFEIGVMLYDNALAKSYLDVVERDVACSLPLAEEFFKHKKIYSLWQVVCRLFAPLL